MSDELSSQLQNFSDLPKNIALYINAFDSEMSSEAYNDLRYSYRVLYVPKSVNRKGQADRVIEFIKADSPEAEALNEEYVLIKEKEKPKLLPSRIVKMMQKEGYTNFNQHHHTKLWQKMKAKEKGKGFGVQIATTWYWYESWLDEVRKYCKENSALFGKR